MISVIYSVYSTPTKHLAESPSCEHAAVKVKVISRLIYSACVGMSFEQQDIKYK